MTRRSVLVLAVAMLLLLASGGLGAHAQEVSSLPGSIGGQSLRPYWHVFIAYSIAILLVLGWVVSIARRLSRLEARIPD